MTNNNNVIDLCSNVDIILVILLLKDASLRLLFQKSFFAFLTCRFLN